MKKTHLFYFIFFGLAMWIFIIYINKGHLSRNDPLNDPAFLYGLLGINIFGISSWVFILMLKVHARKFICPGIPGGFTMDTGNPYFDTDEDLEVGYPAYDVYDMHGFYSRFKFFGQPGGAEKGILIIPSALVEKKGIDKIGRIADAELFASPESKDALPAHVLKRLQAYYEIDGRGWDPEWPIFFGEVADDAMEVKTYSGLSRRAGKLEAELKEEKRKTNNWKQEAESRTAFESNKNETWRMRLDGRGRERPRYEEREEYEDRGEDYRRERDRPRR